MNIPSLKFSYKKAMLIDDMEINRLVGKRTLDKYCFAETVILMNTATEALLYLQQQKTDQLPQIIFLDIDMPEMNGFDFLAQYKQLPERIKKTCAIHILSSSLNGTDRNRALANKYVHSFIDKPLNKEKIDLLIN